jgi:hypothetical protein
MFAKGRDNNAKISAKKNFSAETPFDCRNNYSCGRRWMFKRKTDEAGWMFLLRLYVVVIVS